MLNAAESYPTLQKILHSLVSIGLPRGLPSQLWQARGCSSCWHLHSRFPSGTLVPPDSHLLFLGLSEAQTQQSFFMHCRSNSVLTLWDSSFFPQAHCSCSHKNPTLSKVAHERFHKPLGLRRSHGETTRNTALLLLPAGPVNLLAWLELWKMWASPAFPTSQHWCWQSNCGNTLHCGPLLTKKLPAWTRMGAHCVVHSWHRLYKPEISNSPHSGTLPTSPQHMGLCEHSSLLSITDSSGHGYWYLHTLPLCAPSGSPPGAQDISVNAFSLPVSGPFICQPRKFKAQPFCQSHHHSSH